MKIIITGSSGLIGSALLPLLASHSDQVVPLVHQKKDQPDLPAWNYQTREINPEILEGCDAVIHLAGENIGAHRWTQKVKDQIKESRVKGTAFLSETLASLKNPPKTLICASALGFYGNRGDQKLTESDETGKGFLAETCAAWEKAAQPAANKGIRVVNARFGMILTPAGGALAKLLIPFKMGMGSVIGDGKQYISWIDIDDVVGALYHILHTESLQGPINVASPNPVTNKKFTETLAAVLSKSTGVSFPAFAAKMMFGEMAEEVLLSSTRAYPEKLISSGYQFRFPDLIDCFRHLLKQNS